MKRNKKGFTLVELIVVLVILAILAAILVPTFVHYIDKAKSGSVEVEARDVLVAAQTIATEYYGMNKTFNLDNAKADVAELAEVTATNITALAADATTHKITSVVYDGGDYTATYNGSIWVVEKD